MSHDQTFLVNYVFGDLPFLFTYFIASRVARVIHFVEIAKLSRAWHG